MFARIAVASVGLAKRRLLLKHQLDTIFMTTYFDDLETRSADQRESDQLAALNAQLARIAGHEGTCLPDVGALLDLSGLSALPVLRKSELAKWQAETPPFGGMSVSNVAHIFQSPGPIYEPGGISHDWWRMGWLLAFSFQVPRFEQACIEHNPVPSRPACCPDSAGYTLPEQAEVPQIARSETEQPDLPGSNHLLSQAYYPSWRRRLLNSVRSPGLLNRGKAKSRVQMLESTSQSLFALVDRKTSITSICVL